MSLFRDIIYVSAASSVKKVELLWERVGDRKLQLFDRRTATHFL